MKSEDEPRENFMEPEINGSVAILHLKQFVINEDFAKQLNYGLDAVLK